MDIIGLRVPTANIRNFLCFMLVHPSKNAPETDVRCTAAANSACANFDVLRRQIFHNYSDIVLFFYDAAAPSASGLTHRRGFSHSVEILWTIDQPDKETSD